MTMTEPTYKWAITALDRYSDTGKVLIAHYQLTATTVDGTASLQASIGFPEPTPPLEEAVDGEQQAEPYQFIPFEELTEDILIDWVKHYLGEEQIFGLQAGLLQTISERANPPLTKGLPWE